MNLNGPYWEVSIDSPVYGELQAEAVRAARLRAERYAAALGVTLGSLVELRDPGTGNGPPRHGVTLFSSAGEPAGDFAAMDFDPHTLTVYASVQATWALVVK